MKSLAELAQIRDEAKKKVNLRGKKSTRIVVGMATCGIAAGARPVLLSLVEEIKKRNINDVEVVQTGCIGVCVLEPIVEVYEKDGTKITYIEMTPEKARKVISDHIVNGKVVSEYTIGAKKA